MTTNRDRAHPTDRAIADEIRAAAEALARLMGKALEEGLEPEVSFERVMVAGVRTFTTGFTAQVTIARPV